MLVITRRVGESFFVGSDIQVKIVRVAGQHVGLGISAPRQVPIWRQEIAEAREINRLMQLTDEELFAECRASGVDPHSIAEPLRQRLEKLMRLERISQDGQKKKE